MFNRFAFSDNNNCKTPKDIPGECKDIKLCPSLLSLVKNRPISSTSADYLKKSTCGTSDQSRKVCCPVLDSLDRMGPYLTTYSTRTYLDVKNNSFF